MNNSIFTFNFTFAFASDDGISLTSKHFGDSDKFFIYNISENGRKVEFIKEIANEFKAVDESLSHGAKEKRQSIISFLGKDVNFIVASQQSPNFKKINKNTKVSPIVSKILNIDSLLDYLKNNFSKLVENQKDKLENRDTEVMVVEG